MEKQTNINPVEFTGGYWKSLEELSQDESTLQELSSVAGREFVSSPLQTEDTKDEPSRREFLKLMGASLALSATACVRRPVQKIIPYANAPENMTIGVANYYASSWAYAGEGYGLLVKTREGRPIKLEGLPAHPSNSGALTARATSQILGLYDQNREQGPRKLTRGSLSAEKISWDQLDEAIVPKLKEGGVALLSTSLSSPSTTQLIGDFFQGFKGRHVIWDPHAVEDVKAGQKASYGRAVVPRYRFDKSMLTVSLDCDFLGTWMNAAGNSKSWAKTRKPGKEMSKLVSFESLMSVTGQSSDVRYRVRPSQLVDVAMGLLHDLVVVKKVTRYAGNSTLIETLKPFANTSEKLGISADEWNQLVGDLWSNKGQGLVLAGGLTARTADAVGLQAAVNLLNSALENDGVTVDYDKAPHVSFEGSTSELKMLIDDMRSGKVKTLIIHRLNAVYAIPAAFGFAEALKNVGTVIYTGARLDETSEQADYLAPDHHDFENWSDTELLAGVYAIQQPTIRPLYDTRSLQSSLMNWAYTAEVGPKRMLEPDSWYAYLRANWKANQSRFGGSGDFETWWTDLLQKGVSDTSVARRDAQSPVRSADLNAVRNLKPSSETGVELALYEKVGIADGASANIGWLQEFPDPVTKIVWDNYVMMSMAMGRELGLREGQLVTVKVGDASLQLPAHIQPGLHDKVVGIAVGYGHKSGHIAAGIGKSASALMAVRGSQVVTSGLVATVEKHSEIYPLANTQGHHYLEGRPIVGEVTNKDFLSGKGTDIKKHKVFSLWPKYEYKGYRWGMAIDLNSCTGCAACVVACQSENNVPVVGKKHILKGREMHWLRIDRYYNGNPENPQTVTQPMLCQHCENAPCETVCPVLATVHSSEGLNDMVYNRCVGTRYCSNNCPYKVRRFNWFNYSNIDTSERMALNPDVTVRYRGVMEKCTFCVQRIHDAKNKVRESGEKLKDGSVVTACQQVCPTDAIVFGDINDPNSKVSQWFQNNRQYAVLEELNIVPSIRYLSKVRNSDKVEERTRRAFKKETEV